MRHMRKSANVGVFTRTFPAQHALPIVTVFFSKICLIFGKINQKNR